MPNGTECLFWTERKEMNYADDVRNVDLVDRRNSI